MFGQAGVHPETDFGMVRAAGMRRPKDHWGHAPVLPTMRFPLSMVPVGETGPCPLPTRSPLSGASRGGDSDPVSGPQIAESFKNHVPETGWLSPMLPPPKINRWMRPHTAIPAPCFQSRFNTGSMRCIIYLK